MTEVDDEWQDVAPQQELPEGTVGDDVAQKQIEDRKKAVDRAISSGDGFSALSASLENPPYGASELFKVRDFMLLAAHYFRMQILISLDEHLQRFGKKILKNQLASFRKTSVTFS